MNGKIALLQDLFQKEKWGPVRSLAQQLTRQHPEQEMPWQILTVALEKLGDRETAQATAEKALQHFPDSLTLKRNLFILLHGQGAFKKSLRIARSILENNPDDFDLCRTLISSLVLMAEFDEAFCLYEKNLSKFANHTDFIDRWLLDTNLHPDKTAEEIAADYRVYEQKIAAPLYGEHRPHTNCPNPDKRLKIGYVSPNFCPPSLGLFAEPWLTAHDPKLFELYAYVTRTDTDAINTNIRNKVDHWIVTSDLNDADFAERVRADEIDILVDLSGHTTQNRLLSFARKPTPISLSWWLIEASGTGISAIDYLLIDKIGAPEGSDSLFAEKPWRLNGPSCVFRPSPDMGSVSPLPALNNGFVTFCSLTRSVRLNHRVIRVWSEILKQCPTARLAIDSHQFAENEFCTMLRDKFHQHGITEDRLDIGFHTPPWDRLRNTDISLDPFPHSSGTTVLQALYMGHPVITLRGRVSTGRMGCHHLTHVGHPEWIADSEEDYINKAVNLANNFQVLSEIRKNLRSDLITSPLMDYAGFTARIEKAYRQMWKDWCLRQTV